MVLAMRSCIIFLSTSWCHDWWVVTGFWWLVLSLLYLLSHSIWKKISPSLTKSLPRCSLLPWCVLLKIYREKTIETTRESTDLEWSLDLTRPYLEKLSHLFNLKFSMNEKEVKLFDSILHSNNHFEGMVVVLFYSFKLSTSMSTYFLWLFFSYRKTEL